MSDNSCSPGGVMVKNLPAGAGDHRVQFLGQEDPLEKEMATHSSIPAWKFQGQKGLLGYSPWGHEEVWRTEQLSTHHALLIIS